LNFNMILERIFLTVQVSKPESAQPAR